MLGIAMVGVGVGSVHSMVSPLCAMYTDPGSGAMMWQIIASSGLLAAFYYSRLVHWVKRLLGRESSAGTNVPAVSPSTSARTDAPHGGLPTAGSQGN